MTSKEFVLWLKGFTEGVHEYNITPKQWDLLKEKLEEVSDREPIGFPFGVPNTAPIQTLPFIQPYDPYNPYKITCTPGTTITTTPGSGSITISNPYIASFGTTGSFGTTTTGFAITTTPGYGSISYIPSTTTQMYPSGSVWHYTNGGNEIKD